MKISKEFIKCVNAEYDFATTKFPGNEMMLAALVEEVGELAKALIDHSRGKATGEEVYAEAVQVANMAARIAYEGSSEFPYKFDMKFEKAFNKNKLKKKKTKTLYHQLKELKMVEKLKWAQDDYKFFTKK